MSTSPPTPIPVLVVNELSVLEILVQVAIPVLSLVAAAIAAGGTVLAVRRSARADERAERAEQRAEAKDRDLQRASYAERLRIFAREVRDGYPSAVSMNDIGDPWRDLQREAPDEAAGRLVGWIIQNFGDLQHAFRLSTAQVRAQELSNFYGEVEARIEHWRRNGEVVDGPPLFSDTWPTSDSTSPSEGG